MSHTSQAVVQVAVAVPLRKTFDYLSCAPVSPGTRVIVPFGSRNLVGIVVSNTPTDFKRTLKTIQAILDSAPVFSATMLTLLKWAASYYHHPIGEVLAAAIPVVLRAKEQAPTPQGERFYQAVPQNGVAQPISLSRSPVQAQIHAMLLASEWTSLTQIKTAFRGWREAIKGLEKKSLVVHEERIHHHPAPRVLSAPALNSEQQIAADYIRRQLGRFKSVLLQGVTGSGKTEVYLAAAKHCIAEGNQVLILVPEISLTPQLLSRVKEQLGENIFPLHSGMSQASRYKTWWLAKEGLADAVLGTRSAVFSNFKRLGLIIVDEEHDISYKQQDGFRYHARNLAIKRASLEQVPVVLGSATPSLESLYNVEAGRHRLLTLNHRIGTAVLPSIETIDINLHQPENGLSKPVINAIGERLDKGEQVIVYVNRRGYAPLVKCYQCEWRATCASCDAPMTYHRNRHQFRCHHCGRTQRGEDVCPNCDAFLYFAGFGTQRIEQALLGRFPHARLCRLDRDEANTSSKLYRSLAAIENREVDIIIGTQLITKGHDFANVSLVCVVNADQGLYSLDFRAPETMFQQLLQVSGRAGRSDIPGQVLIQTQQPDHGTIRLLCNHDYPRFTRHALQQRRDANYPPYCHIALFRAESTDQNSALRHLQRTERIGQNIIHQYDLGEVEIMHPVASPMEKLAGRYRTQLLVRGMSRKQLHGLLDLWLEQVETLKETKKVRWSLDIDPMDMY